MSLSWKSLTIAPPSESPVKSESSSLHVTPFFPLALPFNAITFIVPPSYVSLCLLLRSLLSRESFIPFAPNLPHRFVIGNETHLEKERGAQGRVGQLTGIRTPIGRRF